MLTRFRQFAPWFAVFVLSCAMGASAMAGERQDARLLTSTQVLSELMRMPEQNIPTWLLERAYAVAVIPSVIKVGLGIGGRRGKGVLVVRKDTGQWSNPIFINLTGGSFGFQVGVQSADVVLVFTSKQSIEGIVGGKVTLGADASVAAGPIGRQSSAATDIGLTAQVYSYSRASGLFAGVALDGSAITIDSNSNEAFYKRPGILASEIIRSDAPAAPSPADQFIAAVQQSATGGAPAPSSAPPAQPAGQPAAPSSTASSSAPASSGVQTYPMEDPNPGQEPPQ
ncbi:lipid-binding SYLF domain-containing protein [Steroidobacter sp. S1-65]|uniref:Lipid-binding SYLF domain-containing protein n=1 Tax=Steroidobacter gossypii TaxID=2805490 RepID=A0ABS1X276_9GAMM|nr:lipid-binding SYLF domain-containing protein [Steroidobacter gossypii]MBM0107329.1 lipid-binding SYLF domain-containing protein [Steroidobacter gossypii]